MTTTRLHLAAALAAALVLVPAAGADRTPPVPLALRGVHALRLAPAHARQRSCSKQRSHPATRVERKLRPVACEQPPLSQLDLALKNAAASLAAALSGP